MYLNVAAAGASLQSYVRTYCTLRLTSIHAVHTYCKYIAHTSVLFLLSPVPLLLNPPKSSAGLRRRPGAGDGTRGRGVPVHPELLVPLHCVRGVQRTVQREIRAVDASGKASRRQSRVFIPCYLRWRVGSVGGNRRPRYLARSPPSRLASLSSHGPRKGRLDNPRVVSCLFQMI